MKRYAIQLFDRCLSIRVPDTNQLIAFGGRTTHPVITVQESLDDALAAIAQDLNFLAEDNSPDWERFGSAIQSGQIELEVHGHERETLVAAIHAWIGYGISCRDLPDNENLNHGLIRVDASRGISFYETYRFDVDLRPVDQLSDLQAIWNDITKEPESERPSWEQIRSRIDEVLRLPQKSHVYRGDGAMIRIGVLGVVGSGKSTFINGLLGTTILPTSGEACTSTVIEIRYSESHEQGIDVDWFPPDRSYNLLEESRRKLEELKSQEPISKAGKMVGRANEYWALTDRINEVESELDARTKARRRMLEESKQTATRPLSSLGDYTTGLCPRPYGQTSSERSRLPELVRRVVVHLNHPMLQRICLLDTPGLRDPDRVRRRVALDEIAGMDGWMYLAQAPDKESTSVVTGDWNEIEQQGHNPNGVLVLSKIDNITAPAGSGRETRRSFREIIEIRKRTYRKLGWTGDIVYSSAQGGAILASMLHRMKFGEQSAWEDGCGELEDAHIHSLADRLFSAPRRYIGRELRRLFEVATKETSIQRGLCDYVIELCGFPRCARTLATLVNRGALRHRLDRGTGELFQDIDQALSRQRQTCAHLEELLRKFDSKDELNEQRSKHSERERLVVEKLGQLKVISEEVKECVNKKIEALVREIKKEAGDLRDSMLKVLPSEVKKAASGELWGKRKYVVFDKFDSKLAVFASERITEIADLLEKKSTELSSLLKSITDPDQGPNGTKSEPFMQKVTFDDLLTNYSLHRERSNFDVADYEKFFERFDKTTIPRMMKSAESVSKSAEATILSNSKKRIEKLNKRMDKYIEKIREALEADKVMLQGLQKEIDSQIQNLSKDLPGSRQLIEQRLDEESQRLQIVDELRLSIQQWNKKRNADLGDRQSK